MTKKIISTTIVFSFILTLFAQLIVFAAPQNLVKNSSFEGSTTSWFTTECSMLVTGKEKYDGRASVRVMSRKQSYGSPMQFLDLENGKTYTASVWVKAPEGETEAFFVTEYYQEDGSHEAFNVFSTKVTSEWTQLTGTFTLNYPKGFKNVKIFVREYSLCEMYLDKFELYEGDTIPTNTSSVPTATTPVATKAPTSAPIPVNPESINTSVPDKTKVNLISNSDFEKGISGYTPQNAKLTTSDSLVSGNKSMMITSETAEGGKVTTNVDMIYAKQYAVNLWYKGDAVQVLYDDETIIAEGEKTDKWTLLNSSFLYRGNADSPGLIIKTNGEACVDACSLYELPPKLQSAENIGINRADGILLENGDFEAGKELWTGVFNIQSGVVHSGTNAAYSSGRKNNYDGPRQTIQLEPNTDYLASAWVKLESGSETARMRMQATGIAIPQAVPLKTDEWKYVSYVFNSGNNTSAILYVQTGGTQNIYVDDFAVVKYIKSDVADAVSDVPLNPEGITSEGKKTSIFWNFECKPGTGYIMAGWSPLQKALNSVNYWSVKGDETDGNTLLKLYLPKATITTIKDKSLNINADEYKYISVKGSNNTGSSQAQLQWYCEGDSNLYYVNFKWDSKTIEETILDMSDFSDWKGTITEMRFIPSDSPEVDAYGWVKDSETVTLKSISVFSSEDETQEASGENVLNRAEFVQKLSECFELLNYETKNSGFYDTNKAAPWYDDLLDAIDCGIVKGNSESTFSPANAITREQAAVMIMRVFGYFGKRSSWLIKDELPSDADKISPGMSEYAIKAAQWGIVNYKSDNCFDPQGTVTEAEADEMFRKALILLNGTPNDKPFVSDDYVETYDIVRITAYDPENGNYLNPFDAEEVKADAVFTAPDGTQLVLPGYYDMFNDYEFDPRRSVREVKQQSLWKFRFTPTMAGEWTFDIRLTDKNGVRTIGNGKITAVDMGAEGFIRADSENARFVYENGEPFFGFGANLAWPKGRNFVVYEDYFHKYADLNGINFASFWLCYMADCLEGFKTGLGRFNSVFGQSAEYVMLLAKQHGVKLRLPIKTQHPLVASNADSAISQYTSFLGGPLDMPNEVYSNPETIAAYKNELRYVVARYSAFDNIVLWDFWNEEEAITGWLDVEEDVSKWHDMMQKFMYELDPYHHVMGTSGKSPAGEPFINEKPLTEFLCYHSYNMVQPSMIIRADAEFKKQLYGNKPSVIEEFSIRKQLFDYDKEGAITHEAIWGSLTSGTAGTTAPWWWYEPWQIENEHWNIFGPVAGFMEGFEWPDKNIKLVNMKTSTKEQGDFVIPANYYESAQYGKNPFGEAPIRTKFEYDFTKEPVRDVTDIIFESIISNGYEYSFDVNLPEASNFVVATVGSPVSSRTNGNISVSVDGTEVHSRKITEVTDYISKDVVPIPAGKHTIVLTNSSTANSFCLGWVAFENMAPLTVAEAAVGENNAALQVRDVRASYANMLWSDYTPVEIVGSTVELTGLSDGNYELIWWNTYEGFEVSRTDITVKDGIAPTVEVPAFTADIAAKIIRK